jgi:hypothetical protein
MDGECFYDIYEEKWLGVKDEGILVILGSHPGYKHPN